MKEKLTLEMIAPYLPYKLKYKFDGDDNIAEIVGLELGRILLISDTGDFGSCEFDTGKPLLRSISQLTKEIEHNGEKFYVADKLYELAECEAEIEWVQALYDINPNFDYRIKYAPYPLMKKLFEYHFDVFGLIEKGLAIEKQ